jgi:membrane protein
MNPFNQNTPNMRANFLKFFSEVYRIWIAEKPTQYAAALAYYAIFSFVPVIYLAFTLADIIFAKISVSSWFYNEITIILGENIAADIQNGVASLASKSSGDTTLTSIIGIGALFFSASLIFAQLQHALNSIWQVPPPSRGATNMAIRNRLFSFVMLIGVMLIFILAAVINFIISIITGYIQLDIVVSLISFISLAGLAILSFFFIYKYLPNAEIAWKDILLGASVAGLLVSVIIHLLGSFLGVSRFSSAIEAAGVMAVLLMGFYLLGQIFVFGAVLIRVHAVFFGSGILPRQ